MPAQSHCTKCQLRLHCSQSHMMHPIQVGTCSALQSAPVACACENKATSRQLLLGRRRHSTQHSTWQPPNADRGSTISWYHTASQDGQHQWSGQHLFACCCC